MSSRASLRRAARWSGAALLAVAVVLGSVVPATATPVESARRRAAELRRKVAALELDAQVANEDYGAAQDQLTQIVTAHLSAKAALDDARDSVDGHNEILRARARSLYMSGGSAALYLSVLEAADIGDAFSRFANVSSVMGSDARTIAAGEDRVARIAAAEKKLADITRRQSEVEEVASDAADRVRRTLTAQRDLLAHADAEVLRLVEEQRRAEQAAAERAFLEQLAIARGLTVVPGKLLDLLKNDPTQPPNDIAARAIAAAQTQLGKPYEWGATGPNSFDCSGLTGWAYRQAGLRLPRTSRQQWYAGSHPDLATLAPGDLLFWGSDRANPHSIHHVALYIGAGRMIAAPRTGLPVRIQPVYLGDFFGVTRPTAPASGQPS